MSTESSTRTCPACERGLGVDASSVAAPYWQAHCVHCSSILVVEARSRALIIAGLLAFLGIGYGLGASLHRASRWLLGLLLALLGLLLWTAAARAGEWQPSPGHVQLPLWPGPVPDALPHPKPESVGPPPGRDWWPRVNDVSHPTMTVYAPTAPNTGAAVVVFPGGGYQFLAMDLEGTEICDWLVARGITCVLLKYRVPDSGPTWKDGKRYYPKVPTALQDAQRAMGLVRQHAGEWKIDPQKIGVIGFSAGGHLVASLSTNFGKRAYPVVDAADALSCRPDFAIVVYPGHLWVHEDEPAETRDASDLKLRPDIRVRADTPPTFLLHAEDDTVDSVQQTLSYYVALKEAGIPVEMHLYAKGGHAFGVRPTPLPIGRWPVLVEQWLQDLGVLPAARAQP